MVDHHGNNNQWRSVHRQLKGGMIMTKILWFVKYGPDSSHMWEAKSFDKLKDAREFANNLPLSPTGGVRPTMIERYEYIQSRVYGDVVKIREVKV
jgi:hypothetical protein